MIKKYTLLIVLMPLLMLSQNNKLQGFNNLVNKTWIAEGKWSDGGTFKYETTFKYKLNNSLIVVNSKGYTNKEKTLFGDLSHGIRQYNSTKDNIQFWEFDVFGNLIQGTTEIKNRDIWYHYKYGDIDVTDHWQYINEFTYKFTVGTYEDSKWKTIYLETEIKLKNE